MGDTMQKETNSSKSNRLQDKIVVVRVRSHKEGEQRITVVRCIIDGKTFDIQLNKPDLTFKEALYSVFETIGTYENFNR
jgi:hypothetical protein